MSLAPGAGDLINISITHTNAQSPTAINSLYYRVGLISGTIPGMVPFLTNVATEFLAAYQDVWKPAANVNVSIVGVRATSVFPLPRSVGVAVFPTVIQAGSIVGDALPLQDSITILKRTAVGNRWGLGRFFFVGLAESEQANGVISIAQRAFLDDVALFLGSNLAVAGTGWNAILNPCLKRGPEDNPVSITNVTSCQVSDNIIKTQRRRRPGKGI